MVFDKVQEFREAVPQQSIREGDIRQVDIRQVDSPVAPKRVLIRVATVCLTLAGVALVAPSALSQDAARSTPSAVAPYSACAIDPQGLMCSADQQALAAPSASVQANTNAVTILQPLTNAQMEQLSNVLLGFLYFVLPVGFGLGLFLHDRYQAYRAATLDAQIKLLEKLWEQSPQA
jgi:hypothetical protein